MAKPMVGIVGLGIVGSAVARGFLEHASEVRVYDIVPEKRTHDLKGVLACDFVFVSLPTPSRKAGGGAECIRPGGYGLCTKIVDDFFRGIAGCESRLVLRSTVPVGTTMRLSREFNLPALVHSPEFLTARCSFVDFQVPTRNIVGFVKGSAQSLDAAKALQSLYETRFPGVPVFRVMSDASELTKVAQNTFFGVKVGFFNQLYDVCERIGCDFEIVRSLVLTDGRIAHAHTAVPGPDGKTGYGGTCIPKDAKEFADMQRRLGLDSAWVDTLTRYNELRRDDLN